MPETILDKIVYYSQISLFTIFICCCIGVVVIQSFKEKKR